VTEHPPSKQQILDFILSQKLPVTKRELARAFLLKGSARISLKRHLKDLAEEGYISHHGGKYHKADIPETLMVRITQIDRDGDLMAEPLKWSDDKPKPTISIYAPKPMRGKKHAATLRKDDKALVKLHLIDANNYYATIIRVVKEDKPSTILGRLDMGARGTWLQPTFMKRGGHIPVVDGSNLPLESGLIVRASTSTVGRFRKQQAEVIEIIGPESDPKVLSTIAVEEQNLPQTFSDEAIAQAAKASIPKPDDERIDLRDIPFVTIDDEDARDFDDAVWAEPDTMPENNGGWHAVVAIADVSHYVKEGSPLDMEARKRGNSVYLPDRVIPMLPEALSNEMCSLKPDVDRACMAVHLHIDKHGNLKRHKFVRGLMRSTQRLTYNKVQKDAEQHPHLYGVFKSLLEARARRGTLELDIPETKIILDKEGHIQDVKLRTRLDSHRLIEELMIAANVAAALELEKRQRQFLYRIHDTPSSAHLDDALRFIKSLGFKVPQSQSVTPKDLTDLLLKTKSSPYAHIVSDLILRSQSQAEYQPRNIGHFGLSLTHYCHFTSPIRRYADLIVHRALAGELNHAEQTALESLGNHLSDTERRASKVERSTVDRLMAAYLAKHLGQIFKGRITGVASFGLFVTLEGSGATGLLPQRLLPGGFYLFDERKHMLRTRSGKQKFALGQDIAVRLEHADPALGVIDFTLASRESKT
jgi:ribonuclease R